MNNKSRLALGLILASGSMPALALVGGVVDPNSTSSPWAGVVSISTGTGTLSGALIDPWHVLTAAHVVDGYQNTPGKVVVNLNFGGDLTGSIAASQISVHPDYASGNTLGDNTNGWNDDVAVITLSQAAPAGVPAYPLYDGVPDLTHGPRPILTLVAYGAHADGISATPQVAAQPSVKRVGQNQIDRLVVDDEGSGQLEVFLFDLDGPDDSTNQYGGPTLGATLEAGYAAGDSGSPAFILDNGVWKLAGIAAINGTQGSSTNNNLQFGAVGGGMLVAPYTSWIQTQQLVSPVPEPQTWAMLLAGLGLVGLAAARAKR